MNLALKLDKSIKLITMQVIRPSCYMHTFGRLDICSSVATSFFFATCIYRKQKKYGTMICFKICKSEVVCNEVIFLFHWHIALYKCSNDSTFLDFLFCNKKKIWPYCKVVSMAGEWLWSKKYGRAMWLCQYTDSRYQFNTQYKGTQEGYRVAGSSIHLLPDPDQSCRSINLKIQLRVVRAHVNVYID